MKESKKKLKKKKEIEEKERFVKDWVKWNGYELKKLDDKGEKSEWSSTKMRKTEAAIQEIQSWIEKFKKLGWGYLDLAFF